MKVTIEHQAIKKWAKDNNGSPQIIEAPDVPDKPGLRIDFPGSDDDIYLSDIKKGRNITWEEFFSIFETEKLAFVYKPHPKGNLANAYRFIKREETEKDESAAIDDTNFISGSEYGLTPQGKITHAASSGLRKN